MDTKRNEILKLIKFAKDNKLIEPRDTRNTSKFDVTIYIDKHLSKDNYHHATIDNISNYSAQHYFYRSMKLEEAEKWVCAFKNRCFEPTVILSSYQGLAPCFKYSYGYLEADCVMLEFYAPGFIINILHLGITGPKSEGGVTSWSIGRQESNSKQQHDFDIIDGNGKKELVDFNGLGDRLNDAYEAFLKGVLPLQKFEKLSRGEKTRLLLPYVFFYCIEGIRVVACREK